MATTKLYLDTRATAPGTPAPIKLQINHKGDTVLHSIGIRVTSDQWDIKTRKIIRHPQKQFLNTILTSRKNEWDLAIIALQEAGKLRGMTARELKMKILQHIDPDKSLPAENLFLHQFCAFADSRKTPGTRGVYRQTLARMKAYDPNIAERTFEDIDFRWMTGFDAFLSQTAKSANARAIHFRNIRAVFNNAIDDEVTTAYPFRKFKIKTQRTRKRALSVDAVRILRDFECEDYQRVYRDLFILMIYLCGINAVDLLNAPSNAIVDGRLEYIRAKTHKPYSVKVEPEALEIIERYKGRRHLLCIMDTCASYADFLRRMDHALKRIGPMHRQGRGGRKVRGPLFPELSQYWCRHTWATLAAELDIPKEVIAAGLGHGGNSVTDIYIDFNLSKVDEANRKVIDYVLSEMG